MLKTIFAAKGRLSLSLSLIGLLSLYSAGAARAQDASQDAATNAGNNQSPSEQAADRQLARRNRTPTLQPRPNDPNAEPTRSPQPRSPYQLAGRLRFAATRRTR